MRLKRILFRAGVTLALAIGIVGNVSTIAQAGSGDGELKADPRLLEMAADNPDATFMVIVQRVTRGQDKDGELDAEVTKEGGRLGRKFSMISSFSAQLKGKRILKLAQNRNVRWISADAPLFNSALANLTVYDTFPAISYAGDTGTVSWAGNWTELGEGDGAGLGKVRVVSNSTCASGYCLRIGAASVSIQGKGISRPVNLKDATTATLTFNYRRSSTNGTAGSVLAQVSADGGANWTTLATYALNVADSNQKTASFDIQSYANQQTVIRFIGSGTVNRYIYIDNVKVSYSAQIRSDAAPNSSTVADQFNFSTYSESDGTQAWLGDWAESDAAGAGFAGGNIRVVSGAACANGGSCLSVTSATAGDSIYRAADLSHAISATLTLWRDNQLAGANGNDAVTLEASADGSNWTALRTWTDSDNDLGQAAESFDLLPFAGASTLLRLRVASYGDGGSMLFDDVRIEYSALQNVYDRAVNADAVWKGLHLDGSGVNVAVVDSGINPHADLNVAGSDTSRLIASVTTVDNSTIADGYGHGTHVVGIIAGDGRMSGKQWAGMAPGSGVVSVKVANDIGMAYGSDLIRGLQWVYDNRDTYHIKVVNISLNSSVAEAYNTSPIDAAVEILWFNGIVVVVSAGNSGAGIMFPPANDPFAIVVGAANDNGTVDISDDVLAGFSAYGITEDGFSKPDIVAPGKNIISLLSSTSGNIYVNHPANRVDDYYFRMSGTSMAAPVVSGAVALLLQDEPNLNPDQVKYRLMSTARQGWAGYDPASAGAGMLDIDGAVNGTSLDTSNTGVAPSAMLSSGSDPISMGSVGWNSVGWNTVGWNSVGWNTVGWNSVGWNTVGWNTDYWGE
ncbi:MAG TPA: S8 family peptidase [Anaerolineales bacterium]|nr:S8 family peptidase [Anaerolineales bacterium]